MIKIKALLLGALLLMCVSSVPTPTSRNEIKLQSEDPCIRQGGSCMYLEECSKENRVGFGVLCPLQASLGVTCCYAQ